MEITYNYDTKITYDQFALTLMVTMKQKGRNISLDNNFVMDRC